MHPPRPIDPRLGAVFRVNEALAQGTTSRRLRARDLIAPFHGVRATRVVAPLRGYAPRLRPGDRFSDTTAATLWGVPLPAKHQDAGEIHVASTHSQRPRAKGCIGHESRPVTADERYGLPVSDPAQTLIECATLLGLDDLVAIADHLVLDPRILDPLDPRPHATLAELENRLRESRGHGVRLARRALALSREGVESPMETRLRLLLTRAGVPEPRCGYELRRDDGSRIGWFDLAWPQQRVIAEYDGDVHRTSARQYDRDISRFDDASAIGWPVIRVRARGVLIASQVTVRRVTEALG